MRLAIIDLETTGLDPNKNEIIEIGLVLVESNDYTILDTFDIKVKPENLTAIDPGAVAVNGYNKSEWKDAVSLHEALELLASKVQMATMLSYNITFDYAFLQAAFDKTGIKNPMHYHRLDLLSIAWVSIPHSKMQSWALKTVCAYLRIPPEPKVHRGANGAMKAYEVYRRLTERV